MVHANDSYAFSFARSVVASFAVNGAPFDYVLTMEDLSQGQRVANYSVELPLSLSFLFSRPLPGSQRVANYSVENLNLTIG